MSRFRPKMLLPVALLVGLTALGGLATAERRSVQFSEVAMDQVWGSVYRLSATIRSERGLVMGAEYRIGGQTGTLYAGDGLFDSREEQVETYIDAVRGGRVEIRARLGNSWTDWQEVEAAGKGAERLGSCAVSSLDPGSGEWYRGPVEVDCAGLLAAEGAEELEYSLNFEDWQPAGSGFVIEADGVHWVQVRTVSADGRAGLPSTFTVAIDSQPPQVRMMAPRKRSLTHADQLLLDFEAEDDLSGVALVVGDLNGEYELQAGVPVELWQLPLGRYTVSVLARDHAGNAVRSAEEFELEVTVDLAALNRMVQYFGARGKIDSFLGTRGKLTGHLRAAIEAEAMGDPGGMRFGLSQFVDAVQQAMAEGMIFTPEARVLIEDATYLMEMAEDDWGDDVPPWWDLDGGWWE